MKTHHGPRLGGKTERVVDVVVEFHPRGKVDDHRGPVSACQNERATGVSFIRDRVMIEACHNKSTHKPQSSLCGTAERVL